MTINVYAKKWCEEEYDFRKEDFFIENAYYVAEREWVSSGIKHGIFSLIIAVLILGFQQSEINITSVINVLVILGIFTIAFWFYGIRNYDANSIESGLIFYLFLIIFLFWTKSKVGILPQTVFAVSSLALWLYLTIIRPIAFFKTSQSIKKKIKKEMEEEEDKAKQSYHYWEKSFKAFRYGIPEHTGDYDVDKMEKARELFHGYTDDLHTLKTRYRQLAKQYHPDKGGETEFFQCIIAAYEEVRATFRV